MSTQKRGKVYYSRLRVPSHLINITQKKEVVKSLRTSSYSEALTLSCILEGRIARLWAVLIYRRVSMTPRQINKLIENYAKQTLEEYEDYRINPTIEQCGDQLEAISGVIVDKLEENCFQLLNNDFSRVSKTADELLEERNIQLDRESDEFRKLCRELLIAEQLIWKAELKRMEGDYSDRLTSVGSSNEHEEPPTDLLSNVIEAHIKEHEVIWEPRGIAQAKSSLNQFLQFVGDKPIGMIEKEDARNYKAYLSKQSNGRGGTERYTLD